MNQKYAELRSELDLLRSEAAKNKVEFITVQYEKERLEQRERVSAQQLKWYEKNYHESMTDHLQQTRLKTEKIHNLLHQLDQVNQENLSLDSSFKSCQARNQELLTKLNDAQNKILDLQSNLDDQSIHFQHELQLFKDLSEKHQELAEKAQKYAATIAQNLSEAKAAYLQLENEAALQKKDAEQSLASLEEKFYNVDKKYKDLLHNLCGGLTHSQDDDSNELIDLFSSSYATIKAQWSGKTYTELFELLMTKENKLSYLESRNEELNEALQSVFTELETRAPLYKQLIQENEQMKSEKKHSHRQLIESEKERLDIAQKLHQFEQEKKENDKKFEDLQHRCHFLVTQLIHLLSGLNVDTVLEKLRTNDIREIQPSDDMKQYIRFDDVESLVHQNQSLLSRHVALESQIAQLSSSLDTSQENEKIQELSKENEELKEQLQRLNMELEMQVSKENTESEPDPLNSTTEKQLSTSILTTETSSVMRIQHLESVLLSLETKLKEADEKLMAKETQLVQVTGELKYITLEKDQAKTSLEAMKEELDCVTSKCSTYSLSLARWEEKNEHLMNELQRTQKSYEEMKQSLNSMTLDKNVLEKAHSQILEQISKTAVERDMYSRMFNETQSVLQQQLSQAQKETQTCRTQIQDLELRIASLTSKLEDAQASEKRTLSKHAKEIQEVQKECMEKLMQVQHISSGSVSNAPTTNVASQLTMETLPMKKLKKEKELDTDGAEMESDHQASVEQVAQLESDLQFLSKEVQRKDIRLKELLEYAKGLEAQLALLQSEKENWLKTEIELNLQLKTCSDEVSQYQSQFEAVQNQIQAFEALATEKSHALDELQAVHAECETKWKEVQIELESTTTKYLHEFQAHASDVQALETLKHTLNDVKQELNLAKSTMERALTEKLHLEKECKVKILASEENVKRIESFLENVREQNENLYSQMAQGDASNLIQLLRTERDALLLEKETNVLESARKLAQYERTIEHLKSLQVLAPVHSDLHGQIDELKNQLQVRTNDLQLLRESNTTLRQERQHFEHMYLTRQSRLDQLEGNVSTSRHRIAELEANVESLKVQVERYSKEAQEWRHKYTHLFQKYEAIDPEQHLALQKQVSEQQTKLEDLSHQLEESKEKYQETVSKANVNLGKFKDTLARSREELRNKSELYLRLEQQFRQETEQGQARVQELQQELQEVKNSMKAKEDELQTLQEAFEKKKQEVGGLKTQLATFKIKLGALPQPALLSLAAVQPIPKPPPSSVPPVASGLAPQLTLQPSLVHPVPSALPSASTLQPSTAAPPVLSALPLTTTLSAPSTLQSLSTLPASSAIPPASTLQPASMPPGSSSLSPPSSTNQVSFAIPSSSASPASSTLHHQSATSTISTVFNTQDFSKNGGNVSPPSISTISSSLAHSPKEINLRSEGTTLPLGREKVLSPLIRPSDVFPLPSSSSSPTRSRSPASAPQSASVETAVGKTFGSTLPSSPVRSEIQVISSPTQSLKDKNDPNVVSTVTASTDFTKAMSTKRKFEMETKNNETTSSESAESLEPEEKRLRSVPFNVPKTETTSQSSPSIQLEQPSIVELSMPTEDRSEQSTSSITISSIHSAHASPNLGATVSTQQPHMITTSQPVNDFNLTAPSELIPTQPIHPIPSQSASQRIIPSKLLEFKSPAPFSSASPATFETMQSPLEMQPSVSEVSPTSEEGEINDKPIFLPLSFSQPVSSSTAPLFSEKKVDSTTHVIPLSTFSQEHPVPVYEQGQIPTQFQHPQSIQSQTQQQTLPPPTHHSASFPQAPLPTTQLIHSIPTHPSGIPFSETSAIQEQTTSMPSIPEPQSFAPGLAAPSTQQPPTPSEMQTLMTSASSSTEEEKTMEFQFKPIAYKPTTNVAETPQEAAPIKGGRQRQRGALPSVPMRVTRSTAQNAATKKP